MGQLPARLGQRARTRQAIERVVNAQSSAIVTVEQRRARDEARLKQLEEALEWAANLTWYQRLRWLVLGR